MERNASLHDERLDAAKKKLADAEECVRFWVEMDVRVIPSLFNSASLMDSPS